MGYNLLTEYQFIGKDINSLMDYVANQILLPLGGLLIALFVGWFMRRQIVCDELGMGGGILFKAWYLLLRFVAPAAVFVMFILGVGE